MDEGSPTSSKVNIKAQFLNVRVSDPEIFGAIGGGHRTGPFLSRWHAIVEELEQDGGDVVAALDRDLELNWQALVAHTEEIANSVELPMELLEIRSKYNLEEPEDEDVVRFSTVGRIEEGEEDGLQVLGEEEQVEEEEQAQKQEEEHETMGAGEVAGGAEDAWGGSADYPEGFPLDFSVGDFESPDDSHTTDL